MKIQFGFSDAENYRRRENKTLFSQIFLKTSAIEKINDKSTFFLVGEKGTGKTAYAIYYSQDIRNNTKSIHKFIRETDYQKFITLRKDKQLGLSDFTDIWKVIIYLLMADTIYSEIGTAQFLLDYPKFKSLRSAIDDYYDNAFSPEIPIALQFVENSGVAAEVLAKYGQVSAKASLKHDANTKKDSKTFQTNLLTIERTMRDALSSLKLDKHQLLFVDGIDIRPPSVPYEQYLDCVKGLANAVWSVNNDFFPTIRDSKGRMRVIALIRPDIFNSLGLQNRNTKLRDNSAILNWRVIYYSHRNSDLFKMADRMFSAQQDHRTLVGGCWDYYFPFHANNVRAEEGLTSFVLLLRYSWHRPRDIFSILDILRSLYKEADESKVFSYSDLVSAEFRRQNGEYLLGEIRDSLSFYYNETEFEIFLKFFEFLDGRLKFEYAKYLEAHTEFSIFLSSQGKQSIGLSKSPEDFLQILYEHNIVSFFEEVDGERFVRWCFLERSTSNLSPKVKTGLDYEIHYGIANALNLGKALKKSGRNLITNLASHQAGLPALSDDKSATFKQKRRRRRGKKKPASVTLPQDSG